MNHFKKITLFFLFFSFLFLQNSKAITIKNLEEISSQTYQKAGYGVFMDVDSKGYSHVIYYDYDSENFKYAYYNGEKWSVEVAKTFSINSYYRYVVFKLDHKDLPHFLYSNGFELRHTYFDGSTWFTESIGSLSKFSFDFDIDSKDQIHVAYYKLSTPEIVYTYYDKDSGWISSSIAISSSGDYGSLSLKLDESDNPHLAYIARSTKILFYNYNDGISWTSTTVDSGILGYHYSNSIRLELDSAGNPFILYSLEYDDSDKVDLKYAAHNGVDWEYDTLASGDDISLRSFAVDPEGHPHFLYSYYGSTTQLIYSSEDESGLVSKTFDGSYWGSLVLDSSGFPRVAFSEGYLGAGPLSLSSYDGTEWNTEIVDGTLVTLEGKKIDMTLDSEGNPYFASRDKIASRLWMVSKNDGVWEVEKVDSENFDVLALEYITPIIQLDSSSSPHIFDYTDYDRISHFYEFEEGWEEEILYSGEVNSLGSFKAALDQKDHVHFLYANDHTRELIYSYFDEEASTYVSEVIDTYTGIFAVSLSIDSNGLPHILYFKRQYPSYIDTLTYGHYNAEGWNFTEISNYSNGDASLILDEKNNPHIIYGEDTEDDLESFPMKLNYTSYDGEEWKTEFVTSSSYYLIYPSISLDSFGNPHIVYCDLTGRYDEDPETSNDLYYAHRDSSGWNVEFVDDLGDDYFLGTSILIYNDELHIGYAGEGHLVRYAVLAIEDKDGDSDKAIEYGGGDCDDLDPARSSITAEVCGDEIDNNCSGEADEESACPTGTGEETGSSSGSSTEGESESSGGSSSTSGTETGTGSDGETETTSGTTDGMSTGTESSTGSESTGGEGSGSESTSGSGESGTTTGININPGDGNSSDSNPSSCSLHLNL